MVDHPTRRGIAPLATAILVLALGACAPATVVTDAQPGAMVLSDANVSSIFATANTGEIQMANLALERSRNNAVRTYAQRMIQDHTTANHQLERILESARFRPVPVETTRELETTVQQTIAVLQPLNGTAFDRAYMRSQVDIHRWLLQTLDDALIPSARRRDLDGMLRQNREIVAAHLREAEQILGSLPQD